MLLCFTILLLPVYKFIWDNPIFFFYQLQVSLLLFVVFQQYCASM